MEALEDKYAIHAACREGQIAKVEALLSANPKLAQQRDADDRLPLHWAATYNHPSIITHLSTLPSFDIDARDASGWTALMISSSLRDAESQTHLLLITLSATPNLQTHTGQTALHFACSKHLLDTARLLLSTSRSLARVRDKRGQVPLHRAAAVGNVPLIKLLIENLSPVSGADVDGCTPLHHAIAEGHGDAAVALLKAGADPGKRDAEGRVPIQGAPDAKVRAYVLRMAEEEGVDVPLQ